MFPYRPYKNYKVTTLFLLHAKKEVIHLYWAVACATDAVVMTRLPFNRKREKGRLTVDMPFIQLCRKATFNILQIRPPLNNEGRN